MHTDDDRRTLLEALETTIGPRPAEILMAHLPPVGWVDLATRADIEKLEGKLAKLEGKLEGEIAKLEGEMKAQFAKVVMANLASTIATAGLVLAAVSLAG